GGRRAGPSVRSVPGRRRAGAGFCPRSPGGIPQEVAPLAPCDSQIGCPPPPAGGPDPTGSTAPRTRGDRRHAVREALTLQMMRMMQTVWMMEMMKTMGDHEYDGTMRRMMMMTGPGLADPAVPPNPFAG